jgi:hypothetical protein
MKALFLLHRLVCIGVLFIIGSAGKSQSLMAEDDLPKKLKVLIVTGGHDFESGLFFALFQSNAQIAYTIVKQSSHAEAWDRDDLLAYNVVLLYDFQRELNDSQKAKFLSLFDKGVGLVVLHHALLSYQNWPEYERIAGGKYLLDHETANGTEWPASTYKGNVDIDVKVVEKSHPITAGLHDFVLHDELYRGVRTGQDIHTLLTTEGNPLAWTRQEKKSRVVGIIVGHGPAYTDANFQKILAQSIAWTAGDK